MWLLKYNFFIEKKNNNNNKDSGVQKFNFISQTNKII